MAHGLEVPDALAGGRIERDQRIAEQVVAMPVGAVEVLVAHAARGQRHEHHAARRVERHAGPVVGPHRALPGVLRPALVALLAGVGNGMEDPAHFPAAHIVGADMSRHIAGAAHDDQVAVHHPGGDVGRRQRGQLAPQSFAQVDAPVRAKARQRAPVVGIDRIQVATEGKQDAPLAAFAPVRHAAQALARQYRLAAGRIEDPVFASAGRIQANHPALGREYIHPAADDQWIDLQVGALDAAAGAVTGIVGPGHLQPVHIARVDLLERGIVGAARVAVVVGPILAGGQVGRAGTDAQQA